MILRKRKNEEELHNNIKKRCIDWNEMISASSVRNYMLDDPLLDWFKYYNITDIQSKPSKKTPNYNNILHHMIQVSSKNDTTPNTFTQYIMNEGIVFERKIVDYIKNNLADKYTIVQVAESTQSRSEEHFMKTIEYMKNGIDIIYQGVLHDYSNKLFGCPDLLVRSDHFYDIFKYDVVNQYQSSKINNNFHYVVVDIKHSTLHITKDMIHLMNNNNIPAYKGQINIYNRLLESVQGYKAECGYVLGKKLDHNNQCPYSFGTINYTSYDKHYNMKVDDAINWITDMRKNGHKWKLLPKPTRNELYPNMKNKDEAYYKMKQLYSEKINEITSIWQCGYKKRQIAHSKKIYSWKDKRCTPSNMGFNEGKIATTLECILKTNKQKKNIRLDDLKGVNEWRNFGDNVMEFYIDFETTFVKNNNIDVETSFDENNNNIIFMIGIGWEENKMWKYKNFILEDSTDMSELNMINNMIEFINTIMIQFNKTESKFIHWTHAEPVFYNKFLNKHRYINNSFYNISFYDLNKLFLDYNIIVRGSKDFKLKSVANAMYNNKMIKTCWDSDNICSNGLNAMYLAFSLYKNKTTNLESNETMVNITNYNIIDCKVMWEILTYLRKHS